MIALIACIVSTGVFAQEKMDKMATKKDVVMMKDGKMMMIKEGKTMTMDKDVVLKNGTTVMVDGSIKMKDGKMEKMKNGDAMDMDGNKMKPKTKPKM